MSQDIELADDAFPYPLVSGRIHIADLHAWIEQGFVIQAEPNITLYLEQDRGENCSGKE